MARTLKGFRFVAFIAALVGFTGLTLYPIVVKPMLNANDYKELRKKHSFDGYK